MNNLYIHFNDDETRRDFLLEIMGLKIYDPKTGITFWNLQKLRKSGKPTPNEFDRWMNPLEFGKMSSPYLDMKPLVGPDDAPEYLKKNRKPWQPIALMEKGLHRVYTLRTYRQREGCWLVLRFLDTPVGRANYDWVVSRIPREQLGRNVRPLSSAPHKENVSWAASVLDLPYGQPLAIEICCELFSRLTDALSAEPGLFAGDRVYLWENLAHRFYLADDLDHCQRCCHIQAELQPHSSEAWLNLGQYLSTSGHIKEAIAAYQQGLKITPSDEFIYYNLASLLRAGNNAKKAFNFINEAILSNPDRGLNFWLKGRIHAESGDHYAAVKSFLHAIELLESEGNNDWDRVLSTTYLHLAESLKTLDKPSEAAAMFKRYHQLVPSCPEE